MHAFSASVAASLPDYQRIMLIAPYITIYDGILFVLRAGFCDPDVRFVMFALRDGGRPRQLTALFRCHGILLGMTTPVDPTSARWMSSQYS
jgi:hypothetical protein